MTTALAHFRWIAAAIVLIAFSSLPGVAFAHGAHHAAHAAPKIQAGVAHAQAINVPQAQASAQSENTGVARACGRHCCVGAGLSCCSGVILNPCDNLSLSPPAMKAFASANDRLPPSLSSDTLPKPPRTFA